MRGLLLPLLASLDCSWERQQIVQGFQQQCQQQTVQHCRRRVVAAVLAVAAAAAAVGGVVGLLRKLHCQRLDSLTPPDQEQAAYRHNTAQHNTPVESKLVMPKCAPVYCCDGYCVHD
jgi:hypothetical protein